MNDPDCNFTVNEAAEFLAISPRTVWELVYQNKVPHLRISATGKRGRVLIRRQDLIEFRDGCVVRPPVSQLHKHLRV